jgi:hypothetical protein
MLNLPITEGELTFLRKFENCAPILLCGRIAHTACILLIVLYINSLKPKIAENVFSLGYCQFSEFKV